ncbi:hypothetical protein AAG570_000879 [Ranatra chinensis]|uniref:Uncharacterized protein n=1 Tax=Ranatra chinensis TaxID=642074 RepID=A0ABD0YYC2_9HEMI
MKWLGVGDSREMLGQANGHVVPTQVIRQPQQPTQPQQMGVSGDAGRGRAQDDAMVGYMYQRSQDQQWSHHTLAQGGSDGVMYQELRQPPPLQDMQPRNGQERRQQIPAGISA